MHIGEVAHAARVPKFKRQIEELSAEDQQALYEYMLALMKAHCAVALSPRAKKQ